jgi:hypothetical protein
MNKLRDLNNGQKAIIYDDCVRESDRLQRENSKLKSEYGGHIPPLVQETINRNMAKIAALVTRLESLF